MNKDLERLLLDSRSVFEHLLTVGLERRSSSLVRHFTEDDLVALSDTLLKHAVPHDRKYKNPRVDALWTGWCMSLTSLNRIAEVHRERDNSELTPQ